MTGTNHFLAGASIGLYISNPIIAVPAAFMSHFAMDALPHFGVAFDPRTNKRPKIFSRVVRADALVSVLLFYFALTNLPALAVVCMIAALSPDFVWVYKFTFKEKFGKLPPAPKGKLSQIHKDIQKYERTWGLLVELAVAAVLACTVHSLL